MKRSHRTARAFGRRVVIGQVEHSPATTSSSCAIISNQSAGIKLPPDHCSAVDIPFSDAALERKLSERSHPVDVVQVPRVGPLSRLSSDPRSPLGTPPRSPGDRSSAGTDRRPRINHLHIFAQDRVVQPRKLCLCGSCLRSISAFFPLNRQYLLHKHYPSILNRIHHHSVISPVYQWFFQHYASPSTCQELSSDFGSNGVMSLHLQQIK